MKPWWARTQSDINNPPADGWVEPDGTLLLPPNVRRDLGGVRTRLRFLDAGEPGVWWAMTEDEFNKRADRGPHKEAEMKQEEVKQEEVKPGTRVMFDESIVLVPWPATAVRACELPVEGFGTVLTVPDIDGCVLVAWDNEVEESYEDSIPGMHCIMIWRLPVRALRVTS